MDDAADGVHDNVLPYGAIRPEAPAPGRSAQNFERVTGIVGHTPAMVLLQEQIVRFAPTTATVVIHGETGTGKELVAQALHRLSPRAKHPFVAANVAAINESMLATELFGHERGSFTGAYLRHRGLFEQAHGGTLFLDEIGEMAFDAQAALLRVLETREVRPVGAERPRTVNVRLVVATHRNLAAMVKRNLFREDLFYRLNTLAVRVPPLRYRTADLRRLTNHILATFAPELGERSLDRAALDLLGEYGWPGNVRQLQNVLRRSVITSDKPVVTAAHIHASLQDEPGAMDETRDGATVATIEHVLAAEKGNISRSAKRLGIARSTLRNRVRRAGLMLGI